MTKLVYPATAYRQALDKTSPWLVSFVAPAEQIQSWAGIPRKTDNALTGFQRPDEEPRVLKARDYFSQFTSNQSPTSLVLGVHGQEDGKELVRLVFLDSDEDRPIRACQVEVDAPLSESLDSAVERIRSQIERRLAEQPTGYSADANASSAEDDLAAAQPTQESEEAEVEDDEEIELGRSLLEDLIDRLGDPAWCSANEADLRDLAKPATVIDGQHRLLGAAMCERGIPFSVIAIFGCTWAEQVFQFTVVNYTAKGIPDQFITANAALSLTAAELQKLEVRLQQAGVKVIEYELMRVINFDPGSPFKDLVNLSPTKRDDLIGYRTMVQVGKAWYLGKDNAVRQIIDNLYPELKGKKNARNRLHEWKAEDWGFFFKDFWTGVRDQFADKLTEEGHSLWTVGKSNLMVAVVLQQLQQQFLTNLAAQDESFFDVPAEDALDAMRGKVKKRAQTFLGYFSPEMFGRKWKMTQLNTGPGRMLLNDTFRQIADTKGAFQWKNSGLITGKTTAGG